MNSGNFYIIETDEYYHKIALNDVLFLIGLLYKSSVGVRSLTKKRNFILLEDYY